MWKKIKRLYWKQQLRRLEVDMMIFAISFDYYILEKERITAKIDKLNRRLT